MQRSLPLAIVLAALPLRAGAAQAPYPVTARIVDAPDAQQQCPSLPMPMRCDLFTPVGAALRGAAARLFLPLEPGSKPSVELSATNAAFEVASSAGGYRLSLQVRLDVSLEGGGRSDIRSRGEALLADLTPELVKAAIERAANDLADHVSEDLSHSPQVVHWLRSHGVEPEPSLIWPVRQSFRVFADLGAGVLQGGDGQVPIFSGRLGAEWKRFSLQLFAAKTSPSFNGAPSLSVGTFEAALDSIDLGVEGGVSIHLLPFLDLRVGPGLHYLFGDASLKSQGTPASSFSVLTPTVFASLLLAFNPRRGGTRMTLTLEARKYMNSTVALPELSRTVPVADFSFAVLFGFEMPLGPRTAYLAGRAAP